MAAVSDRVAELDVRAHWADIKYRPHPGQRLIHASQARHRVAALGRRAGKSFLGGHEGSMQARVTQTVLHVLEREGQRHEVWLVGPAYSDSAKEFRVIWDDIKRMGIPMDKPGSYYNPSLPSSDMVISLFGGKMMIRGMSSKYPDTLVGEGLVGVIMCEAAKMKASIWPKYIRPTLADWHGWSLWLSTPEGKNHFYEAWQRGQDPSQPAWASWRMPSYVNSIVFPLGKEDPEVADMKAEMSGQRAEQEIEASFTDFVGAVFKDFDEEVHVRDVRYRRDLPIYGCCDFGWANPFVWLAIQVDVWDNVYVLGEFRVDHMDINEIGEELVKWPLAKHAVTLYPDPSGPDDAQILSKKLHCSVNLDTGGEKKYRLEYIRQALKQYPEHLEEGDPDKQPKLLIDRSCVGLIREMQDYRYPENKSEIRPNPEEPLDKDDHGPEALGRWFRGHYGPPTAPAKGGRGQVHKVNMTQSRRRRRRPRA